MREYTTVDKSEWGQGEWTHEPDKVQWVDGATGLDCLAVRQARLGHWCGYVGVPPEHPFHGKGYSECDDDFNYTVDVEVHGGLTYARECQETDDESKGICHVPEPGRPDNVWWFGFDCAHSGDLSPAMAAREVAMGFPRMPGYESYRPFSYVQNECTSLAAQLALASRELDHAKEPTDG